MKKDKVEYDAEARTRILEKYRQATPEQKKMIDRLIMKVQMKPRDFSVGLPLISPPKGRDRKEILGSGAPLKSTPNQLDLFDEEKNRRVKMARIIKQLNK